MVSGHLRNLGLVVVGCIARLDGVSVYVYGHDHPPPHIHFRCADFRIKMEIDTGLVPLRSGTIRDRTLRELRTWTGANAEVLHQIWKLAFRGERIPTIEEMNA